MSLPPKKVKPNLPEKSNSFYSYSKENIPPKRTLSETIINSSATQTPMRSLQVLAEISSNFQPIKTEQVEPQIQPCTSQSLSQAVSKNREYCVYQNNQKKFIVIRTSCVKAPNVESISVGKTYDIIIGKIYAKGLIKFLGNKIDCLIQLRQLETNFGQKPTQSQTPPAIKRKTISIDSIKSDDENVSQSSQDLQTKIKELEQKLLDKDKQIMEKDLIIDQLNEEIRVKKEIIDYYKNNFDNQKINAIKAFCHQFIDTFSSEEGLKKHKEAVEYKDPTEYISPNIKSITVSTELKKELVSIVTSTDLSVSAFRKVMMKMLPDIFLWAKESKQSLLEKHGELVRACFELVNQTHEEFKFNTASSMLNRIITQCRERVQKLGYTVITTYDSFLKRPVYEIVKNESQECNTELNDDTFAGTEESSLLATNDDNNNELIRVENTNQIEAQCEDVEISDNPKQ